MREIHGGVLVVSKHSDATTDNIYFEGTVFLNSAAPNIPTYSPMSGPNGKD